MSYVSSDAPQGGSEVALSPDGRAGSAGQAVQAAPNASNTVVALTVIRVFTVRLVISAVHTEGSTLIPEERKNANFSRSRVLALRSGLRYENPCKVERATGGAAAFGLRFAREAPF